ncbi:glycosyltransferase [Bacillus alkalicellulosilyticus]|uniref:glycosyltransferase n=1 Tax=Alkalihalobacterium alkalicellulosilyticum TaxID=1912214 RepID=UPI000996E22B|nr:glycosyltransferase [Bacillus alkalicellulosilyticus]
MKKILFVIDSLSMGGAEKSLVTLLNCIDQSKYQIDLLMFKRGGDLETLVPNFINILPEPEYFRYINKRKISLNKSLFYLFYRYKTSFKLRINNMSTHKWHSEQVVYKNINKVIGLPMNKNYDAAIAYSQGFPTYFVAEHVNSRKKLAWINTDYANTLYNKEYDYQFYKKYNNIIAVSENTLKSVESVKKEYSEKMVTILDIINPKIIIEMAEESIQEPFDKSLVNIVTVGRLEYVKGYDKAIKVALILRKKNIDFKWYFIGEGTERDFLQREINQNQLNNNVFLLGKKMNPYPYMKECDIYVQTSNKEGFGLSICEAKILKKPIVCTNFPTATQIINQNIDGLIVEHDPISIFNGILKVIENREFKQNVIKELNSNDPYNTLGEIERFYQLIEV